MEPRAAGELADHGDPAWVICQRKESILVLEQDDAVGRHLASDHMVGVVVDLDWVLYPGQGSLEQADESTDSQVHDFFVQCTISHRGTHTLWSGAVR